MDAFQTDTRRDSTIVQQQQRTQALAALVLHYYQLKTFQLHCAKKGERPGAYRAHAVVPPLPLTDAR